MLKLSIDSQPVEVSEGTTILDAAKKLAIEIPTLCYLKTLTPNTSCMVCVVKVEGRRNLAPACATVAQEGMVVLSECEEVHVARRTALELLLSDHVGDCMGPCQVACPAHMNIPQMIRQIAAGQWDEAVATVKAEIAMPAVAGRLCSAPCEKACRRGQVDQPVSVCLLKRFVADVDLEQETPYVLPRAPAETERVAIVGAGPAGLAAAAYLQQEGFVCTIYDDREQPGGQLRYGVLESDLPHQVLEAEIEQIRHLGVTFKMGVRLGRDMTLVQLRETYGAVFVAVGACSAADLETLGFDPENDRLTVKQNTYETEIPAVFAGGDVWRQRKMVIRSLADGREAAVSIAQFLRGQAVTGITRPFNSRMGKLASEELSQLAGPVSAETRLPSTEADGGYREDQARAEAERCLHCDCRKLATCKLRDFAQAYGAKSATYQGERRSFSFQGDHPDLIYESGKCISCGICVGITQQQKEKLGLTFIGRGFSVEVAVPFGHSIEQGLVATARDVVAACPTGALAFK